LGSIPHNGSTDFSTNEVDNGLSIWGSIPHKGSFPSSLSCQPS